MTRLAALLALLPSIAFAAPPPKGSEEYVIMHPHGDWIATQHDRKGRWCCQISDGALVNVRTHGDDYQVSPIYPDDTRGIPRGWFDVPPDKVILGPNPVKVPIAWFYQNRVQCFVPGDLE